MRTILATAATVTALALAPPFDQASAAEVAAKSSALVTIGASSLPDARPADPRAPLAPRAPRSSPAPSPAPLSAEKPQPSGTSVPLDVTALSATQRQKLAALETASPAERPSVGGVKPADRSTILPPPTGAPRPSPEELERIKPKPTSDDLRSTAHLRGGSPTAVLGTIPRPEWSAQASREKPKDVSTATPAEPQSLASTPSEVEMAKRAAPTKKDGKASKAPEASTTRPRDPSAPAANAHKTAPSEVQP